MTNIRVPRRLLERIEYLLDSYVTDIYPEEDELRALLNQPKEKSAATVKDSLTVGKAQMARDSAELRRLCAERDQLKAENERLANCLRKANGFSEKFERNWYLVSDERDTLRAQLDEARELLVAAQELLCLVWEYEGDVFGVEHNNATDVNIGIDAWLKANKRTGVTTARTSPRGKPRL